MKTNLKNIRISMSMPVRSDDRNRTLQHMSMSADVEDGCSVIQAKLELETTIAQSAKISLRSVEQAKEFIADAKKDKKEISDAIQDAIELLASAGITVDDSEEN